MCLPARQVQCLGLTLICQFHNGKLFTHILPWDKVVIFLGMLGRPFPAQPYAPTLTRCGVPGFKLPITTSCQKQKKRRHKRLINQLHRTENDVVYCAAGIIRGIFHVGPTENCTSVSLVQKQKKPNEITCFLSSCSFTPEDSTELTWTQFSA